MQSNQLMSNCSSFSSQKLEDFHSREGLGLLGLQLLQFLNWRLLSDDQLNQPSCNWQLAFKMKPGLTNNVVFFSFLTGMVKT